MDNNSFYISSARSRSSLSWPKVLTTWEQFTEDLKTPERGEETLETYLKWGKAQQDDAKDVGGFVGGTFRGKQRRLTDLKDRSLITLDLDRIPSGRTREIIDTVDRLGHAAVIYSTRKHRPQAPRLRVIWPLSEPCGPAEYEPIARRMAEEVGMEYCDPTTFEGNRLMFWPSCSADGEYVYHVTEGEPVPPEEVLATYKDWTDISSWPTMLSESEKVKHQLKKQEDPLTKRGIVGQFCRTYDIQAAIDEFIPDAYTKTDKSGRLTFTGGSTSNGAIIYEDGKFLYSHHATDPCSGQLVNAWDLVRLHRFGNLDAKAQPGTTAAKMPSYKAMAELANRDERVIDQRAKEAKMAVRTAFSEDPAEIEDWTKKLDYTAQGALANTLNNVVLYMSHDEDIGPKIANDTFAQRLNVVGRLPWDPEYKETRGWNDTDSAHLYHHMEKTYHLTGKDRMEQALLIVADQNKYNDVERYLESLEWDGVPRLDTALIDYLGAEDTPYTRAVFRKAMLAACRRATHENIKFDYMTILCGPQGSGKSTFLRCIGKRWFSDSMVTFEGKEAAEIVQGKWIIEVAELQALGKTATNAVKMFLSKEYDDFRPAYGRRVVKHPRRCILFGTTNDSGFLKDPTGERRFWPVDVKVQEPTKDVWKDLPKEVDQIWAEAYYHAQFGIEALHLNKELEEYAREQQMAHKEESPWTGIIAEYLEKPIPANWYQMTPGEAEAYNTFPASDEDILVRRDRVCLMEVWMYALDGKPRDLRPDIALRIRKAMLGVPGWVPHRGRFGTRFGPARGFKRVDSNVDGTE
jgi:predicted P-loop ATPase